MAKRSQKSRFGPGKDRIKPDSENASEDSSADATVVEVEGEQGRDTDDEADDADGSAAEADSRNGKGKRPSGKKGSETTVDGPKAADSQAEPLDAEQADDLATGYTSEDDKRNPQTCCSSCHTVFEVSRELLNSSDTRVRCGECLSIFDALANLREGKGETGTAESAPEADDAGDPPAAVKETGGSASNLPDAGAASLAGLAHNASPLDVTYADFALFSADAGLPDMDYLDETREVQAFDYDDLGEEDEFDESIDETLYAEDVIEDARASLGEGVREAVVDSPEQVVPAETESPDAAAATGVVGEIDELLNSLKKPELPVIDEEEPVAAWWFRGLLFLAVLVLAAGLYGYREREALQNNRLVRPVLQSVCAVFGCTVAERVDLTALKVIKRTVFSHPDIDDTLIINIGFVNQAEFSQRYPTLVIRLTDRNGGLIVKRDYQPAEYLDNWQQGDVLDVGKSLDISLNMEDPGNQAMSFELDFK